METTKPRLGRGLSALLRTMPTGGDGADEIGGNRLLLAVENIRHNPFQPRKNFDDEEIAHLSESIKNHGVLQPLVVRQVGEEFQLIAGERRLRAAQKAGLAKVPVHVVDFNDQQVLEAALVENIQRSDLNPIEKAQGFKDYIDRYRVTQEALAARLGMDRTTVSNLVNLLNLPPEVQDAVRLQQLSLGHAKILKGLADPQKQVVLCKEVIMKALSVKALEAMIKQLKAEAVEARADSVPVAMPAEPVEPAEKTAHVQSIEDELRHKLAMRIDIRIKGKDRGQIVIGFESNDDFERVIETLRR
jgi:ParB family transcriptional regulator, chromosome partitioning protein